MLAVRDPATGELIQELATTPVDELPRIFERARDAQNLWGSTTLRHRTTFLLAFRETIINHVDELAELLSRENGKPRFESLSNEILPCVDLLTFYARKGPRLLRDQRISMSLLKHRASYLNYWPLGVVAVISPWNYPLLLPFGEIAMALLTGNSVVFKPSEITPLIGLKIQELAEEAGLPPHVLQTVIGDGVVGAAMIQQKPAKIFFTGSVTTGKKIMAAAAEHLIPVCLELGGKDAMIVLPDADLELATSAALWGGFGNSGQVCASVERILVHEKVAAPFQELLTRKLATLRQSVSVSETSNDLGAITFEGQKRVYESQLADARKRGLTVLTGGEFSADGRFLKPTVISGAGVEESEIYTEETFGPVVAITTFRSIAEAIKKANSSKYGLLASVITRDHAQGERIARQLEVGTVTINEVTYTAGLSETPWGGVKESGFGRKHSELGLFEFVNVRHIHKPRSRLFVFKAPWWFPYTPFQYAMFRSVFEVYRRHWLDKLRAIPHFLWNAVQFLKNERRL